jgi:hypothetical protein
MKVDKELLEFQNLMPVPDHFEDGFGWRTIFMAFFVGLLMVPAQMYMSLVAGTDIGGAAQWVTVILYVEVSRRAFTKLRRPEIFVLFYMCGAVMSSGYAGSGLLWNQFLVQSEEIRKMGITEYIPKWFAPTDPAVLGQRSFLMSAWLIPLILMVFGMMMSRLNYFGLGYVLFRLAADVERLPFPMAPVNAMGMTALADAAGERETWRWRTFCFGSVLGAAFGAIYLAVPNITGALFSESIQILPLPFVDITSYTEHWLKAMPFMVSFDLGLVVAGLVLPFWAMVGSFIGLVVTMIANPTLQHFGILKNWQPGIGGIQTIQSNYMDFYFSFGLGLSLAVGLIGFVQVFRSLSKKRREMDAGGAPGLQWRRLFEPPPNRGDISLWVALSIYFVSTTLYIILTWFLVNRFSGPLHGSVFPLGLLIFYGFVYTPIISYVSTRMEGIVGQQVAIPFVREATFIFSGYKGAAIWFAPIPMYDYSRQAMFFKTTELTGTKFSSLIKAEVLIFPIVVAGALLFSQFIWSIDTVPSQLFPYANQFWELSAYQQGIMMSSTLPGEAGGPFQQAFRPEFLAVGLALALGVFGLLQHFGLPIFLVYGVVRGFDQSLPHAIIPMFIGALLGRFVFRRQFGENWPRYRIVFAAGFSAGVGLVTMLSLGIVFMTKSVIKLPV